jgi:hypothetical protein
MCQTNIKAINAKEAATTNSGVNFGARVSVSKKRIIPKVLLGP